jgi:hypothetical protein
MVLQGDAAKEAYPIDALQEFGVQPGLLLYPSLAKGPDISIRWPVLALLTKPRIGAVKHFFTHDVCYRNHTVIPLCPSQSAFTGDSRFLKNSDFTVIVMSLSSRSIWWDFI